jgi:outer membrane protein TolC
LFPNRCLMKNSLRLFFSGVLAIVWLPLTSGWAEECSLSFSFEEFRAYAFSRSPQIAEIDRGYALEVAKAIDTKLLTNPELSVEQVYTRMKLNGDSDPQVNAFLAQPLKLSNFGKRDQVAALLRKTGDVQKRAKLLEFSQKLLLQYTTLYAMQATDRILADAERSSSEKVTALTKGVKEGLISAGSEALFQGERYRVQAERDGIQASIAALQGELSPLLGARCRIVAAAPPSLGAVPSLDVVMARAKDSALSESSRADLLAELTKEQSSLADLDAFPAFAPRVVYQHTNDGGDFIGAGISIPLPVWNRNQAESTRASAEHMAAERKQRFLQDGGLELMVRSLRAAAASAQRQTEIYQAKVIPSFESALKGEERLYREGKGNILDVWQTFRAVNEARLNELTIRIQAVTNRAQLSVVVGEEV